MICLNECNHLNNNLVHKPNFAYTWRYRISTSCRRDQNHHVCRFIFNPGTTSCPNNGASSCSHLCLASPSGYKCACPGGTHLSEDEHTCKCPNGRIANLGLDFCPPCPPGVFTCGSKCIPEEYDSISLLSSSVRDYND